MCYSALSVKQKNESLVRTNAVNPNRVSAHYSKSSVLSTRQALKDEFKIQRVKCTQQVNKTRQMSSQTHRRMQFHHLAKAQADRCALGRWDKPMPGAFWHRHGKRANCNPPLSSAQLWPPNLWDEGLRFWLFWVRGCRCVRAGFGENPNISA